MAAIDLQLHLELDEILKALQEAGWVRPVRCRECARRPVCRAANIWATPPGDDWFCADGKRKGGAGNG